MRLVIALVVALAGCTEESAYDRLEDLLAKNEIVCQSCRYDSGYNMCTHTTEQVMTCMNDALTAGGRAMASSRWDDMYWYPYIDYWFAVDHQVERFVSHPSGSNYRPDAYAYERPACTGPYRVEGTQLVLDGCPPDP